MTREEKEDAFVRIAANTRDCDFTSLAKSEVELSIRLCQNRINDDLMFYFADIAPDVVIKYASARFSDGALFSLVTKNKATAYYGLIYCANRFTDEQLWTLAQQMPMAALRCCAARLTDEQINQLRVSV